MLCLRIANPARAAGGEERILAVACSKLVQQLRSLLHYGEIGAQGSVVYQRKAETVHRGEDLSDYIGALRQAEFRAERHANRRRNLCNNALFRIVKRSEYGIRVALDRDGSGRADSRALSAVYAVRFRNRLAECRADDHAGAAVGEINRADILNLAAHTHAVAAENAFGRIAHDGSGRAVDLRLRCIAGKADVCYAEALRKFLKTAFAAFFAGGAVTAVRGEQQLQYHSAVMVQLCGVGADRHAVLRRGGAGGNNAAARLPPRTSGMRRRWTAPGSSRR